MMVCLRVVIQITGRSRTVAQVYHQAKYITPSLKEETLAVPNQVHRSDTDLLQETKLPENHCSLSKTKINTKTIDIIRYEPVEHILWIMQIKFSDQKVNDDPDKIDRCHTKAIPALLEEARSLKDK
jgi:hypothetical protein